MMIQQHDGVVVGFVVFLQGFAKLYERERCCRGRGMRQEQGCGCPPSPPPSLYRVPRGGTGPIDGISRGRRPGVGGLPPKQGGAPSRVSPQP